MFSYSGDPASSPKDAVRFEVQDTNEKTAFLQDAEVVYAILTETGEEEPDARGILCASARCCEVIARQLSRQADEIVGSLGATYSKSAAGFTARAKELRLIAQGSGSIAMPAISRSEKRRLRQDHDRVQPLFRRRQHQMRGFGPGSLAGGTIEENEGEW